MKFGYIGESLKADWEQLIAKRTESGFMQTFFWSEFKRQTGWETFKIGVFEEEKLIAGAVVMKFYYGNTSFLYIPEGPVLDYSNSSSKKYFSSLIKEIKKIVELEKEFKTTHLRVEPRINFIPDYFKNFKKAPYDMEPKQTLMIDLTQPEDKILALMKPKGRYNISVAQKFGVKVKFYKDISVLKTFLDIYHQTKERNKFKGKEDDFFEKITPLLINDKKGKFYIAYSEGRPLAAALVIFFGNRASYFFGGSLDTDREKMATYLLHWEIIKDAKANGYSLYDLWGIAEDENDTKNSWYGFTKFKRQFGGERYNFIGTYDLVYDENLYQNFLEVSGEVKLLSGGSLNEG